MQGFAFGFAAHGRALLADKDRLRRLFCLLMVLPLIAACEGLAGGSSVHSAVTEAHPPKSEDCPLVIYRAGQPAGSFAIISRLTARIEGPPPPGGDLDSVMGEFRKQACDAGADALAFLTVRRTPDPPLAIISAAALRFTSP